MGHADPLLVSDFEVSEADFSETRKFLPHEVARIFFVPKTDIAELSVHKCDRDELGRLIALRLKRRAV
jgi:hypothetical protein